MAANVSVRSWNRRPSLGPRRGEAGPGGRGGPPAHDPVGAERDQHEASATARAPPPRGAERARGRGRARAAASACRGSDRPGSGASPRSRIGAQRAGHAARPGAAPPGRPARWRATSLARARRCERPLAVERLVQRDAEAELIGPRIDVGAGVLLRRHVGRRADQARRRRSARRVARLPGAAPRDAGSHRRRPRPREAEVGHPHAAVVADQHVVRLEVAVDQAGRGGRRPAPARPPRRRSRISRQRRARVAQPSAQVRAAHQLHRDEHLVAEHADVVDRDDVRVRDAGHRARLADDAGAGRGAAAARPRAAQELDRDLAAQLRIVGGVDHAHRAGAEQLAQHVARHAPARRGRPVPRPHRRRMPSTSWCCRSAAGGRPRAPRWRWRRWRLAASGPSPSPERGSAGASSATVWRQSAHPSRCRSIATRVGEVAVPDR